MAARPRARLPQERLREWLLRKVDTATPGGCWLWNGAITPDGYGIATAGPGRGFFQTSAHRLMYEACVGPIPDGLQVDHLCRVRNCVNPDHLEPVTPRVNSQRAAPATRTRCVNGHEYTLENTRVDKTKTGTQRHCRACARENTRRYRAKTRSEAASWAS